MAVTAAVNDMFQVRVKGFIEGQETNNVIHFLCTGTSSDVEVDLILKLLNCFVLHLLPVLSNKWTLDTIVWKRVSPTLSPDFITTPTEDNVGALTTDSLPTFNAALVSIRTAEGGRSKRGRMFLAGIPESATTGSRFDLTGPTWLGILAFVQCVVTSFIENAELGGGKFNLGVYSRKLGGSTFPYTLSAFVAANNLAPVGLLATMRSRKIGKGS